MYACATSGMGYAIGAAVLGNGLRTHCCKQANIDMVLCYTNDVPQSALSILTAVGWKLRKISHIIGVSDTLFRRPHDKARFEFVFTKLRVFDMIEYAKICLLDVDMLVLRNIDSLFNLSAPAAMGRGKVLRKIYVE